MRRLIAVVAVVLAASLTHAGEAYSRAMTGWFNVTTPEGWKGRRYMDGANIFAEEFDSRGTGRIDVWRFYRRGLLSSEERDLNGDGRVDYQSRWDARDIRLLEVLRDTGSRGVNDLEIEADGSRRWVVREDRNLDGIADRILFLSGPQDFFDRLGFDLAVQRNVIDSIPREYWHELWTDDTYTGNITSYYRFNRGAITHRGEWDGRKIYWRKGTGDYAAPPPPVPPYRDVAVGPPPAPPIQPQPDDWRYQGDIRDPFDLNAPGRDPYEGMQYPAGPLEPVPPYGAEPPMEQPQYQTGPVYPSGPGGRDRTRYEGLPPGESAARSVPARMRPPGVSKR